MTSHRRNQCLAFVISVLIPVSTVHADIVTEWAMKTGEIILAAKLPAPPANRIGSIVQTAVYEAVNAITARYPSDRARLDPTPGASIDAAVAAASRAALSALVPSQQAAIDKAYQSALSAIPDGKAKSDGIALGEKAAAAIIAFRADDGSRTPESYRPHTTPGVYVPTTIPAVPRWGKRKPWLMSSPDQFRPGPPPALDSEIWARDYNEIKSIGAKESTQRTAEQTDIARFWEATEPTLYYGLGWSVTGLPGRDVTQNARLLAVLAQAMDDAAIAVFDAKYHYGFWRPLTAIRNGDIDGNDATVRDSSWLPFIDTPMHPEYPCAHCIIAGAAAAVLEAEIGTGSAPTFSTKSSAVPGVVRSWTKLSDAVQEVSNARIYDGVHFRNSTEVGTAMGKKIGELAAKKLR